MSPEEEAKLREGMARIRAGNDVDLDDPDENFQGMHPYLRPAFQSVENAGYWVGQNAPSVREYGESFEKRNAPLSPEEIALLEKRQGQISGIPVVGGAYFLGKNAMGAAGLAGYGVMNTSPALYAAQKVLDSKREDQNAMQNLVGKTRLATSDAQETDIKEQQARKAIEALKRRDEYLAKQKKAEEDRDKAAEEGRKGYRVERALYDSTVYKKDR